MTVRYWPKHGMLVTLNGITIVLSNAMKVSVIENVLKEALEYYGDIGDERAAS